MLLAELVATARTVGATSARNAKIGLIAELLARLDPDEAAIAVGLIAGEPHQGRIGVGWATVYKQEIAPASVPSIEITEFDRALDRILATTGQGSSAARGAILSDLFSRAT